MGKKKGKKVDVEKKAALQARKEAKAEKSARKKLAKQQGNDVLAATEDEELDKVLQAYKSQDKAENVEKATLQDIETEFPLARANATLVSCVDDKKDLFYCFGGEYYDGVENVLLDDLLRLDVAKQEWKMVVTSPRPPPRCAHSCITYKQNLYVFGGELATASEYHHYRDLWKFDIKTLKWTEIQSRNSPSARSGHACFLWKSYMIVFGGFFEAARETKFYNDLHVFNLQTEQWMALPASRLSMKPEPRSACNVGIFGDKALVHGGFTKLKTTTAASETKVHTDAWVLNLGPLQQQKAPTWDRWISSTKGNAVPRPPNGRAGTSSATYKDKLLVFGGVRDTEQLHHKVDSIFYNDLVALDVERRKWFPLRVKEKAQGGKRRRRKPKEDGGEEDEEEVKEEEGEESSSDIEEEEEEEEGDATDQTGWDIDMLRANMFAFVDGDGNIVYEKIEDSDTKVEPIEEKEEEEEEEKEEEKEEEDEEEEKEEEKEEEAEHNEEGKTSSSLAHKKITSSSVMVLNPETQAPEAVERAEPLPRINPSLLVHGNMMYLMGGILEVGDREITLDDFWALDLRKREKWECLWKGTMHNQVWRGAVHDDDDSYISTGREGEDSEDEFGSSDEEDEMMGSSDGKKSRKSRRGGLKEEIAELNAQHNLDDENRTPMPNESLADFYSRTSEYWNGQAAEAVASSGEELSNKELKREGFNLAKERFDELKPVLDRLMELSLASKAEKAERKAKGDKKKEKKGKRM